MRDPSVTPGRDKARPSEWCEDAWHHDYEGAPADGTAWMEGGGRLFGSPVHVNRGGCFGDWGHPCRSANREWNMPGQRYPSVGFRIVLELSP